MSAGRHRGAWLVVGLCAGVIGAWFGLVRERAAGADWSGVDEVVIGRFAQAAGRSEAGFALDWIQGDLLLFAFLCAGLVAGAVLGYCARMLFAEPRSLRADLEPSARPRSPS